MRGSMRFSAAVSLALVAVLALPATALAVDGSRFTGSREATRTQTDDGVLVAQNGAGTANADARKEQLQDRIANTLRNRSQRFERAQERIRERLERVEQLCDRVEDAGGDVAQIRQRLEEAEAAVDAAEATEALAIEQFANVPDAENRRAAFGEARDTARQGVRHLNRAREQLNAAACDLKTEVEDILEDIGA